MALYWLAPVALIQTLCSLTVSVSTAGVALLELKQRQEGEKRRTELN